MGQSARNTTRPASERTAAPPQSPAFVGTSRAARDVRAFCGRVGPRPCRVLIVGETGTGKAVAASLLHAASGRPGAFVHVSAGALTPTLLHDALFGHVRGAYSGAVSDRAGCLEHAHEGTLFLDEVQDLSAESQQALLTFLDDGCFTRLGTTRVLRTDVRVLAAVQRPAEELAAAGRLRPDLLYRLRQAEVTLRPLREHAEDLAPLAEARLDLLSAQAPGGTILPGRIAAAALDLLRAHRWPGNVRELHSVVDAAAWEAEGEPCVGPRHLPPWFFRGLEAGRGDGEEQWSHLVEGVLRDTRGNVAEAARRLGRCTRTVRRRAARAGLSLAAVRERVAASA